VHPARALPRFAPRSFRRQFPREGLGDPSAPRVVLWTDTFSDHFHPDVLWAGARVLADAGHHVVIPRKDLCCGRPLYDYGMLDRAKKLLERDLRELRDDVEAGTPIVGLEPSCVAVFRDELPDLLHGRDDAKRLSGQVVTLAEHLAKLEGWSPPRIDGALLVQRHCHHASVMGFRADEALLRRTGADVRILEQGCCGMAGGFGFERDHYDVSMRIARQGVLGAIERDGGGATLVADGFSCRTQVEQGLGRAPKHLAQLLDEATRPRR
jgi:Fe-S oxidoreductase